MNNIQERLNEVRAGLPQGVRLVAVSKYHPNEAIEAAYAAGQRIFGESKVQEMTQKHDTLPPDIEWHFIGHLQTNKVKYIAPYVAMIHAVDSYKLLAEIDRHAARAGRTLRCLLQVHIAQEETKYGFSFDECRQLLADGAWRGLSHVRLCGVMGMATNTGDDEQIRREFCSLHTFFREMKQAYFATDDEFREISMGMSHDYPLAVAEGSTLVRVGSKLFGERDYSR